MVNAILLDDNALTEFPDVRFLGSGVVSIQNNSIVAVPSFAQFTGTYIINLAHNQITQVEAGAFSGFGGQVRPPSDCVPHALRFWAGWGFNEGVQCILGVVSWCSGVRWWLALHECLALGRSDATAPSTVFDARSPVALAPNARC